MKIIRIASLCCALACVGMASAAAQTTNLVLPSERNYSEPSRKVPATEYTSAYCTRWNDACTECASKGPGDTPTCNPMTKNAECKPREVECSKVSWNAFHHVCLTFSDGCNQCVFSGGCSAMLCYRSDVTGTHTRPVNFSCEEPRKSHYDGVNASKLDGTWIFSDGTGRSCEISADFYNRPQYHHSCLVFKDILRGQKIEIWEGQVVFHGEDQRPSLSFSVEDDFDHLKSNQQNGKYHLDRVSIDAPDYGYVQRQWFVKADRVNEECRIFLPARKGELDVVIPQPVVMSSGCSEEQVVTSATGDQSKVKLPTWTKWDYTSGEIKLTTQDGLSTSFKRKTSLSFIGRASVKGHSAVELTLDEEGIAHRIQ